MTFEEKLSEIPGEYGFYKQDTMDTFIDCANRLMNQGFSQNDTLDILTDLYQAVRGEYGN